MKKFFFLAAAALMTAASAHAEVEYTDVTKDMFHNWTAADATGEPTTEAVYPEYVLGTEVGPGGMVYGYSTVYYLSYADLSEYSELQVVAKGTPRLLFNRTVNEGPCVEFSAPDHNWAIADNGDGTSTYTINLAAMVENSGFAHLHSIKATWGGPVTVISLKAGKEVAPALDPAIEPVLVCGNEDVALNSHSAVSVEGPAQALAVNFVDMPWVKYATYALDEYAYNEEEGEFTFNAQLGSGALSLSTVGYVAFDPALEFVAGRQYVLTVKAWDVTELFDENWNMAQPLKVEEFHFNGAGEATYTLGQPVLGLDRNALPEDMINLGIKVTFPEAVLPADVNPMDLQVTVSASLYGIMPDGAEGGIMPLAGEDEVDPGMGVTGPICLAEAVLHYAQVEGGVITAYLFPGCEDLAVGNQYALVLESVMVMNGEEVICEMPEDAYWDFQFTVTEVLPTPTLGEPAFGIDDNIFYEDMIALGVPVRFPDMVLPEGIAAEDCDITVSASLYGVPVANEPMPISGEDDLDGGFAPISGPVCLAEAQLHTANVVGGVVTAMLFPEMLEVGNYYAIIINAVTVIKDDEIILEMPEDAYWTTDRENPFEVVAVEPEDEIEISPAFIAGEEQVVLNDHSAASVECAEALMVRFMNAPTIKVATYAIDKITVDEEGQENAESIANGELSINTFGYVEFDPALVFVAGNQYKLTVKAWDVTETVDAELNVVEPLCCAEFVFNGAADAVVVGEPVWGVERGELAEDMVNIGLPVSFPEITLPFGVSVEENNFVLTAILAEEAEEEEDDIDAGFGVNAQNFYANAEGGELKFYLFPEQMEAGKTYTVTLCGLTVLDLDENVVASVELDSACTFTVAAATDDPTAISTIIVNGNAKMINVLGQKANKGIVIVNGVKALVK